MEAVWFLLGMMSVLKSTACKIQSWIWEPYYVVKMFDEPLRINPATIMAKALDSQLFVPGSRSQPRRDGFALLMIPDKHVTAGKCFHDF